jgi:hypothetical protein
MTLARFRLQPEAPTRHASAETSRRYLAALGGGECRASRVSVAGAMSYEKTADAGEAATWLR